MTIDDILKDLQKAYDAVEGDELAEHRPGGVVWVKGDRGRMAMLPINKKTVLRYPDVEEFLVYPRKIPEDYTL